MAPAACAHPRSPMRISRRAAVFCLAVGLAACATAESPPEEKPEPGQGGAPPSTTASTTNGGFTHSSSTGQPPGWQGLPSGGELCSEPTKYIYVVSTMGDVYRYWPPTYQFDLVGRILCDGQPIVPGSMAISRDAVAWVEVGPSPYKLLKVDLSNGDCVDSGYIPDSYDGPYAYFGMAFTGEEGGEESLYVAQAITGNESADGLRRLGRLDSTTLTIETLGSIEMWNSDLSGTGDARLYAFEKSTDSVWSNMLELEPETGTLLSRTPLPGVPIGSTWAVAAWGGDVYVFSSQGSLGSAVVRYRPSTGAVTWLPQPAAPFAIIGAGVSTCAPTEPPQ